MAETTNVISNSQSDIYNKLLLLAAKYTDTENFDFVRSSLFGYVTESLAMGIRDSSLQKAMLYNESFLNSATIPKSIYNWAKTFNVDVLNATPAYADMTIRLNTDEIEEYSKDPESVDDRFGSEAKSVGVNVFIIDKDTAFFAAGYEFHLENSVMIYKSNSRWYARYIKTEEIQYTNYYTGPQVITTIIKNDDYGNEYLEIHVRMYQYNIQKVDKTIISSSIIDRKIHKFEFQDQFVKVLCRYKPATSTTEYPVPLYFSSVLDIDDERYAYYNLTDTNELEVKFPDTLSSFKPETSSTLHFYIITSDGSLGNINSTEELIYTISDESLRNISMSVTFSDYNSYGGRDQPTIDELRKKIINEISTRDSIITETDLNNYFTVMLGILEGIDNGKIEFVKKRDDILKRVFGVYVLLRNNSESEYKYRTIGTNTIDIFSNSITSSKDIKFGAKVCENEYSISNTGTPAYYRLADSNTNSSDIKYIIPFYVFVTISPIPCVKYIFNLTDDSSGLVFDNIYSYSGNQTIIPSTVSVFRGIDAGEASSGYKFTFTFNTDFDISLFKDNSSNSISLKLTDSTNALEYSANNTNIQYISSNLNEETGLYQSKIEIFVSVDSGNEFSIISDSNFIDSTKIRLLRTSNADNSVISVPEAINPVLTLNGIVKSSSFSVSFKSTNELSLFQNIDNVMASDIELIINEQTKTSDEKTETFKSIKGFNLLDVPVIKYDDTTTSENINNSIKQLFIYLKMLNENLKKLESNTFFDLKFYNTDGFAQTLSTPRTDIDLVMKVVLNQGYSSTTLTDSIRHYVEYLVDISNDKGDFYFSQIQAALLQNFYKEIKYIEFISLNGDFEQKIIRLDTESQTPERYTISNHLDHILVLDS